VILPYFGRMFCDLNHVDIRIDTSTFKLNGYGNNDEIKNNKCCTFIDCQIRIKIRKYCSS
jgi:hypothetical protein